MNELKKGQLILLLFLMLSLPLIGVEGNANDYHQSLVPRDDRYTRLSWTVIGAPSMAVEWGWMGEGAWLATNGSTMTFSILEIDSYLTGNLTIGNFTRITNNTDIARELVLGVWGLTPFFPGLLVMIGQTNLDTLNETAYASAERVQGNYLNGTMESRYEEVTVDDDTYYCLIFEYEQDPSGFGEPQSTYLAYDTVTGILIKADTSVTIINPYQLILDYSGLEVITTTTLPFDPLLLGISIGSGLFVVIIVVLVKMQRR